MGINLHHLLAIENWRMVASQVMSHHKTWYKATLWDWAVQQQNNFLFVGKSHGLQLSAANSMKLEYRRNNQLNEQSKDEYKFPY